MIINTEMQAVLDELCSVETKVMSQIASLPSNDIGNKLIELFYQLESTQSRELIRTFLTLAGVVWLRKLLTNDTKPIASSKNGFASLEEYLGLLGSNDDDRDTVSTEI